MATRFLPALDVTDKHAQDHYIITACVETNYSLVSVHCNAMASISTSAPKGSPLTAKVARAGGFEGKYLPYTSFTVAKSPMSTSRIVVFTTLSYPDPAASKIAPMFFITCSACPATVSLPKDLVYKA